MDVTSTNVDSMLTKLFAEAIKARHGVALSAMLMLTGYFQAFAQQIVDPCFNSITELGKFLGSEDIVNACGYCSDPYEGSNLIEWDGNTWQGALEGSYITLPPPPGCNSRAIWMGYQYWTGGGESVALRFSEPLKAGKRYSFTFTYASAGATGDGHFSPRMFTSDQTDLRKAFEIDRLPATDGWATNTLTFTAKAEQNGHTWIFLHAYESSGMVLAQCDVSQTFPEPEAILGEDILACERDKIKLKPPYSPTYAYQWNTGSTDPTLDVTEPGAYSVTLKFGTCEYSDTVTVAMQDCNVVLVMPNVFTPNDDQLNEQFVPKEYYFIKHGTTRIYDRWGKEIFSGDMFEGWNGKSGSSNVSTGVYYYLIDFTDQINRRHVVKGELNVFY